MPTKATPPRLGHVAMTASDPHGLAGFYRDLLELEIVRQNSGSMIGDAVLLSGSPAREDHELVFLSNAAAQHIAFRVETAEQLRALYGRAKENGVQIPFALESGIAVGFFVRDPEGHAIEIYLAADKPYREKPPLSDPEEIDRLILDGSAF